MITNVILKLFFNCFRLIKQPDAVIEEDPLSVAELKEFQDREKKLKDYISSMRVELGHMNRQVLRYSVAIDEVPGTAELLQYEKRFVELYNQGKISIS